jgi:hypothetical protein
MSPFYTQKEILLIYYWPYRHEEAITEKESQIVYYAHSAELKPQKCRDKLQIKFCEI